MNDTYIYLFPIEILIPAKPQSMYTNTNVNQACDMCPKKEWSWKGKKLAKMEV